MIETVVLPSIARNDGVVDILHHNYTVWVFMTFSLLVFLGINLGIKGDLVSYTHNLGGRFANKLVNSLCQ